MLNKILLILLIAPFLLIPTMSIQAQEDGNIPSWVKKIMVFWGDGLLEDSEMLNVLQWLIDSRVIIINEEQMISDTRLMDLVQENKDLKYENSHLRTGFDEFGTPLSPIIISKKIQDTSSSDIQIEKLEADLEEVRQEKQQIEDDHKLDIQENVKFYDDRDKKRLDTINKLKDKIKELEE